MPLTQPTLNSSHEDPRYVASPPTHEHHDAPAINHEEIKRLEHHDRPTDARARLLETFNGVDPNSQPDRWDALWKDDWLPWDKGFPNPALAQLLKTSVLPVDQHKGVSKDNRPLIPPAVDKASGRRKKAFVPGCGKGYDVVLLAAAGYDAYGLEASTHAVDAAQKWMKETEEANWKKYETVDEEAGRGSAQVVFGDFFKDDWMKEIGLSEFDLIYDYTFLSALPPDLRPAWSLRMSQLLSHDPHAALVCVEFPTYKPPSTGGPPWGLPPKVYEQHLSRPGEKLKYGEDGHVVEEEKDESGSIRRNKDGLIRAVHYQPEQTHEIGKGTDWVSIWRHPKVET